MRKASSLLNKRQVFIFFPTASLVIAADQLTKALIRSHLALGQSLPETGWVRLTHIRNTGAAFGLFPEHSPLFSVISMIGAAAVLLAALILPRRFPFLNSDLNKLSLGLVLGGTIGNLIDRLYLGYVTDFIDFGFWPAFNVADSAIVVGTILFALSLLSATRSPTSP